MKMVGTRQLVILLVAITSTIYIGHAAPAPIWDAKTLSLLNELDDGELRELGEFMANLHKKTPATEWPTETTTTEWPTETTTTEWRTETITPERPTETTNWRGYGTTPDWRGYRTTPGDDWKKMETLHETDRRTETITPEWPTETTNWKGYETTPDWEGYETTPAQTWYDLMGDDWKKMETLHGNDPETTAAPFWSNLFGLNSNDSETSVAPEKPLRWNSSDNETVMVTDSSRHETTTVEDTTKPEMPEASEEPKTTTVAEDQMEDTNTTAMPKTPEEPKNITTTEDQMKKNGLPISDELLEKMMKQGSGALDKLFDLGKSAVNGGGDIVAGQTVYNVKVDGDHNVVNVANPQIKKATAESIYENTEHLQDGIADIEHQLFSDLKATAEPIYENTKHLQDEIADIEHQLFSDLSGTDDLFPNHP